MTTFAEKRQRDLQDAERRAELDGMRRWAEEQMARFERTAAFPLTSPETRTEAAAAAEECRRWLAAN